LNGESNGVNNIKESYKNSSSEENISYLKVQNLNTA
jgi:hypothetical protein